jgi:hypothetical protein
VAVVIYLDGPQFLGLENNSIDGEFCRPQWFRSAVPDSCEIDQMEYQNSREPIAKSLTTLQEKGLLQIWDGMDSLSCNGKTCSATYMADSNHLLLGYAWYITRKYLPSLSWR